MNQTQLDTLKKKIAEIESILVDMKKQLNITASASSKSTTHVTQVPQIDYSKLPGAVGNFDGVNMVTIEGEKYDVPANYAAKSKLVFGDTLKLIEEDGKPMYKHINKVPRQKLDGILTKKDGLWYVLTDRGSYKVSDVAAEFNKASLNAQVKVLLPADNLDAPFATIDEFLAVPEVPRLSQPKPVANRSANPILSQTYSNNPDINSAPQITTTMITPVSSEDSSTSSKIGDDDLV